MSVENRERSRRWFEDVWNARRAEAIDEMMSADAAGHTEVGDMIGLDPFRAVRERFLGAFPDLRFEIEAVASEDDQVAVRWLATGTHSGDALGVPPCGRSIRVRGTTWHRYEDGVMVEGWDTWNFGSLMQHLSEDPSSSSPSPSPDASETPLVRRLREALAELLSEDGGEEAARDLGLSGPGSVVPTLPAEVILGLIHRTKSEPRWLLTGEGPRYREGSGRAADRTRAS